MKLILSMILAISLAFSLIATVNASMQTIQNDTVWTDTNGNEIKAQGGCIFKSGNTYHWFGPQFGGAGDYKFYAVNHYISTDLVHWTKRTRAFGPGDSGIPFKASDWVGRPWILFNSSTSKYVIVIEWGGHETGVRNQYAFLTATSLNGPWTYQKDKLIKKLPDASGKLYSLGDLGAYQDGNKAYLIYTFDKPQNNYAQAILKLSGDFLSPMSSTKGNYVEFSGGSWPAGVQEAASIIKRGSTYYYFTSKCAGWASSETRYRTASSMAGPWSKNEMVATKPSTGNSFNTQHDFVLPITGSSTTTYLYCGDRWSNYTGNGVGKNAWFPMTFDENGIPTINGYKTWTIDTVTGKWVGKQ
jgi:hypothetical protein